MTPNNKRLTERYRGRARLYNYIFHGRSSLLIVLFLFVSFLIQPVHSVFASEPADGEPVASLEATPEEVKTQDNLEEENDEDVDSESTENENNAEEAPADSGGENSETEVSAQDSDEEPEVSADLFDEDVTESAASTTVENVDDSPTGAEEELTLDLEGAATTSTTTVPVSDEVEDESSTTTTTDSNPNGGGSSNNGSDDEAAADDNTDQSDESAENNDSDDGSEEIDAIVDGITSESELGTTTAELIKEVARSIEYVVTEENFYQFSRQSCVPIGDGTFHCSTNTDKIVDAQSVVYDEVGERGNKEIFIKTAKGDIEQITDNEYEDASPSYDPVSRKIVWHRNIDGRFQIIEFDLVTKVEKQLTFSRTNNMEPAVSEQGVIWQAWDGNDWEIMFFDGSFTDQLTDNSTQDLSPVMQEQYAIWSTIADDAQYGQVYSFDTQETVTISNYEGGSIVNPRFVLVYDTQFENGDIVTQRFDPDTGLSQAIAAEPAPEPIDIPHNDATGEIRALIQNKTSDKELMIKVETDNSDAELNLAASSSTDPALDLKLSTSTIDMEEIVALLNDESEDLLVLGEYDLVISDHASSAPRASVAEKEQEDEGLE